MNEMMAREIAAQAEILPNCVEPLAQRIASIAPPQGRILAGGCGDSVFAPAALGKVFGALGLEVAARTSMALAGFTRIEPGDTVILSSISGGTRRTLEAAQAARTQDARLIALTCKDGSPLANAADEAIILPFSPLSRKTPHTLDYGVTLLALTLLARAWSGRRANEIRRVLDMIPQFLDQAHRKAATLAAQMRATGKIFILGAGPELGSAEYGAAKFHE
ncbi:MAG: SIS domain-containing protein, partial [Dongiaceae bacterium]